VGGSAGRTGSWRQLHLERALIYIQSLWRLTTRFAALCCLLTFGNVGAAPVEPAEAVARQFFEKHENFWTESPPAGLYTPELHQLLQRNSDCLDGGESCAIDWDFWTSTQDRGELRWIRVTRIVASGRQRQINFEYQCECGDAASAIQTARLHLVRLNRDWLIDDVIRGKRSVKALLRREFPPPPQDHDDQRRI